MVTARAQLVSRNLFLKNSNCCPAEKSVLGELDWFSGESFCREKFLPETFPAATFSADKSFCRKNIPPENIFLPETFSGGKFSQRKLFRRKKFPVFSPSGGKFPCRKFTGISVSDSSFPGIIISAGKDSGGKLDALLET